MRNKYVLFAISFALLLAFVLLPKILAPVLDKEAKADKLAAEAEAFIESGRPERAAERLAQAVAVHPDKPAAGKVALLSRLARLDPEAAFDEVKLMAADRTLPFPVLLDVATLALSLKVNPEAGKLIDHLLERQPGDAGVLKLAGMAALSLAGDPDEALKYFRKSMEQGMIDTDLLYIYGRLLASSPSLVDRVQGKAFLQEAAEGEGANALSALIVLTTDPRLPMFPEDYTYFLERLRLHPDFDPSDLQEQPGLLRGLALRFHSVGDPGLLETLGQLATAPEATREEQIAYLYLGQQAGQADAVQPVLDALLRAAPDDPVIQAMEAHQQLLQGEGLRAIDRLLELVQAHEEDAEVLSVLLSVRNNSSLSLRASEWRPLLEALLDHPGVTPVEQLRALEFYHRLFPEHKEATFAKALSLGKEVPVPAAEWLLAINEPGRVLDIIPAEAAAADTVLLDYRFRALLLLGQLEAAAQLVAEGEAIMESTAAAVYAAMLKAFEGGEAYVDDWEEAYALAIKSSEQLFTLQLARVAWLREDKPRALRAYEAAVLRPQTLQRSDWLTYLTVLLSDRETRSAAWVARMALKAFPDNPDFINNQAYLAFLLIDGVETALQAMEALVEAYPERTDFAVTLALGYLQSGFPSKASAVLDKTGLRFSGDINPSAKAVYVAVVGANGQEQAASLLFADLEEAQLLPEEWALVEGYGDR
jgi:predicted Zn-dependent protease